MGRRGGGGSAGWGSPSGTVTIGPGGAGAVGLAGGVGGTLTGRGLTGEPMYGGEAGAWA
jgi:hypothetical protein